MTPRRRYAVDAAGTSMSFGPASVSTVTGRLRLPAGSAVRFPASASPAWFWYVLQTAKFIISLFLTRVCCAGTSSAPFSGSLPHCTAQIPHSLPRCRDNRQRTLHSISQVHVHGQTEVRHDRREWGNENVPASELHRSGGIRQPAAQRPHSQ